MAYGFRRATIARDHWAVRLLCRASYVMHSRCEKRFWQLKVVGGGDDVHQIFFKWEPFLAYKVHKGTDFQDPPGCTVILGAKCGCIGKSLLMHIYLRDFLL